jgi:FixJ family two-component response regulator
MVCRALTRLLRANGFCVSSFASAEAFLAREATDQPDCLVLDLNLGGMSGLELQAALAAGAEQEPWIVITAHDSPLTRAHCLQAGAAAYLVKPFDDRQLIDAIDRALGSETPIGPKSNGGSPPALLD